MDTPLQDALDTINAHGCPFCGTEPTTVSVTGPDAVHIRPSGHTYNPIAMDQLPSSEEDDDILETCPECGVAPTEFDVRGPDEIVLQPCGHTVSAE